MESSDDESYVLENSVLNFLAMDSVIIREEWVNEYFTDREEDGEYKRIFPDLLDQPTKFFEYFRMMPSTFYYILEKITPIIFKQSNFRICVSPEEKLVITLRFLSTGLGFRSLAFSFKLAHTTIRSLVYETCEAIWNVFLEDHMPFPTKESLVLVAEKFFNRWGFANCVGCIDGKHVRIKCPPSSSSMFYNYKHFFSVILQGVADADCKFLSIDVGDYGRQSDSGVFQASPLYKTFEEGRFMPDNKPLPYSEKSTPPPMPHVILGDQGYPLKPYLLKPYNRHNATEDELLFNYRLSSVRRVIECAFGILVGKWRVLKTEIQCMPDKVDIIVKCVCLLHNIVIDKEGPVGVDSYIQDNTDEVLPEYKQSEDLRRFNRPFQKAIKIRHAFKNYFNNCN